MYVLLLKKTIQLLSVTRTIYDVRILGLVGMCIFDILKHARWCMCSRSRYRVGVTIIENINFPACMVKYKNFKFPNMQFKSLW